MRLTIALALLATALLSLTAAPALAHHADELPGAERIPGQPDFEKIGKTTYRFLPAKGEYKIEEPGRPASFFHADGAPSALASTLGPAEIGGWVNLPGSELDPLCRSEGPRIALVYTHRPADTTATPTATIRAIAKRMNWKLSDQASQSSGGARALKMAVDCSANSINVYNVATADNDYTTIDTAMGSQLEALDDTGAVKYLVFDHESYPEVGGLSDVSNDPYKGWQNANALFSSTSLVYWGGWETHVPLHELLHGLGASQGAVSPAPPNSSKGHHCSDGWDVLCYNDGTGAGYSKSACPSASGYDTPTAVPIDCGSDTYFDAAPAKESWLETYWNVAGYEDPFLAGPPKVFSAEVDAVDSYAAEVIGEIAPGGYTTSYYLEYGTTTSYGSKGPSESLPGNSTETEFEVFTQLQSLIPNTTYHVRLVAANALATSYGADMQLKTTTAPPKAVTEAPSIKATEATLKAKVNPNGSTTTYQFEYGPTTSYGSKAPASPKAIGSGGSDVEVSETITGLSEGTTYHYRVVASSEAGTSYGADKSFTTLVKPTIVSEPASGVTETSFAAHALINPGGSATTYQVEYGKTTSYGTTVPVPAASAGSGTSYQYSNQPISGLTKGTVYYYRFAATNAVGTTYGEAKVFSGPPGLSEWLHEGEELSWLFESIEVSGEIGFSNFWASTYSCPATAEAVLSRANKGQGTIEEFEVDTEACQGTGVLSSCVALSYEDKGPWDFDAIADGTISIKGSYRLVFDAGCPISAALVVSDLTAFPDEPGAMSSLEVTGTQEVGAYMTGYSTEFTVSPAEVFGVYKLQ